MPLDVAVAPKTLTSTLHYLKRGTEKPAAYRIEPPPGVPRWNGVDDPRDVTIEDARGRDAVFTLDRTASPWSRRRPRSAISIRPRRSRASITRKSSAWCATNWAPAEF